MTKEKIKGITKVLFFTGVFLLTIYLFVQKLPQFIKTALYIESCIIGFILAVVAVLFIQHKRDKEREKREEKKRKEMEKRSKKIMNELREKEEKEKK